MQPQLSPINFLVKLKLFPFEKFLSQQNVLMKYLLFLVGANC